MSTRSKRAATLQSTIEIAADGGAPELKRPRRAAAATKKKEEPEEEEAEAVEEAPPARRARAGAGKKGKKAEASASGASDSAMSGAGDWELIGDLSSVYFRESVGGVEGRSKIAAFDLDDTLVRTRSGNTFAKNASDWQWLYPQVVPKLRELHDEGYKLVIVSNQNALSADKKGGQSASKVAETHGRFDQVMAGIDRPLQAFMAIEKDRFRKPYTGIWELLSEHHNGGVHIDKEASFYVGDAAGRPAGWKSGRKKDFSCTDRKFAFNVGIDFKTPEEFYLGEKPVDFSWDGFNPHSIDELEDRHVLADGGQVALSTQEMVLMVGFPGSGKSTFARRHLLPAGYVHVNRDTLKTPAKCLAAAEAALKDGKSVVVDNTNPSREARSSYIQLADKYSVPVRCFIMEADEDLAQHMNMYREAVTNGEHEHVPGMAYGVYKKKYEEPDPAAEHIAEVKVVRFVPQFDSDEHRKLFKMFHC